MSTTIPIADETAIVRQEADNYPDQASALRVINVETYQKAAELLVGIKGLRERVETIWRPMQKKAYDAWQEVLSQRKGVEEPLERAERTLKASMSAYDAEQRRLTEQRQRELEDEIRRQREREIEQQLEAAELSGASAAEVATIIEEAEHQPVPAAALVARAPAPPRVAGISRRITYRAEVTNPAELIKFVAGNPAYQNVVLFNQTALNQLARAQGKALRIPGVRVIEESGIAVKGR